MSKSPVLIANVNLAAHLILTGYGHWLPNDPRGSGSDEVRKPELAQLGDIHFGRKRAQPSREELRAFHHAAVVKLVHPVLWFDSKVRRVLASGIENVAQDAGYTVWACAILRNHLHLVIRTHRDNARRQQEAYESPHMVRPPVQSLLAHRC